MLFLDQAIEIEQTKLREIPSLLEANARFLSSSLVRDQIRLPNKSKVVEFARLVISPTSIGTQRGDDV
jgi:hypothetical protein